MSTGSSGAPKPPNSNEPSWVTNPEGELFEYIVGESSCWPKEEIKDAKNEALENAEFKVVDGTCSATVAPKGSSKIKGVEWYFVPCDPESGEITADGSGRIAYVRAKTKEIVCEPSNFTEAIHKLEDQNVINKTPEIKIGRHSLYAVTLKPNLPYGALGSALKTLYKAAKNQLISKNPKDPNIVEKHRIMLLSLSRKPPSQSEFEAFQKYVINNAFTAYESDPEFKDYSYYTFELGSAKLISRSSLDKTIDKTNEYMGSLTFVVYPTELSEGLGNTLKQDSDLGSIIMPKLMEQLDIIPLIELGEKTD